FCADRDTYRGHSDIIQPVRADDGHWFLYTCREGDPRATPRVLLYDDAGRRVWGDVDEGHMDMGWVARLGPTGAPVATAIRIGVEGPGPTGHIHNDPQEFAWDALTGEPVTLPFSTYRTLPVDLNGDGRHELVRGLYRGDGAVLDSEGIEIGSVNGWLALAG